MPAADVMDDVKRSTPPIGTLFFVEGLGSIGGNLMQVGIFFYTNRKYGWGLRENFTLAALQGIVYIIGALAAHGLAVKHTPRRVVTISAAVRRRLVTTFRDARHRRRGVGSAAR